MGAALVLDEFALILNLADVSWRPQGRERIDAIVIMAAVLVVVAVGGGCWQAGFRVATRQLPRGHHAPARPLSSSSC